MLCFIALMLQHFGLHYEQKVHSCIVIIIIIITTLPSKQITQHCSGLLNLKYHS